MTKIPYNIERAVPSGQGFNSVPIAVADISAVPEATAKLGQSLMKAGEAGLQIKDRQDKFNYSMAYSTFLQKSIDFQNNLEQDSDYINAPQKYKENLAQFKSEALKELGSNNYAENLKQQMNLYESKNYGQVLDTTVKKQTAASLAKVDQQVDANFEAFSRTKDPQARFGLLASSVIAFSNAIPDSDPNKAIKIEEFTNKIEKRGAVLDLSQRSPQEQIRLLKQEDAKSGSNITKYLTPEKRMEAIERATQAIKQENEQNVAAIRNADFLAKRNAENDSMNIILNGGTTVDIPLDQYAKLDESARNNLNKIQAIKNGTLQPDHVAGLHAYDKYSDLYINDPSEFAKIDPITIRAEVASEKVDEVLKWHQAALKNIPAGINLVTYNKIANQTLNSIGVGSTTKEAVIFKNRLQEEVDYFKKNHNKEPSQKELQEIAHSLVVQATFDTWHSSPKLERIYKKSREAIDKQIVVPEDFKTQILQLRKQKGYTSPVDENYFKKLYLESLKRS